MRLLLKGPVLVGFDELFDAAYGDPNTPRPYAKIAPTRIGKVLLPFACPSCEGVIHSSTIDKHTDLQRRFSWCPHCRKRYVLDAKGIKGDVCAPAQVEVGGKKFIVSPKKFKGVIGCDDYNLLGATHG